MSQELICPWEALSWEESSLLEESGDPSLVRADVHRAFRGGPLEGESRAVLLCARPEEGKAGFVATEFVSGALHDRTGTFVLQYMAAMGGEAPVQQGVVVPSSGTGDLKAIRGACRFGHQDGASVLFLDIDLD